VTSTLPRDIFKLHYDERAHAAPVVAGVWEDVRAIEAVEHLPSGITYGDPKLAPEPAKINVGDEIPPELYNRVANALASVYIGNKPIHV